MRSRAAVAVIFPHCLLWMSMAMGACGSPGTPMDDEFGAEEFVRPVAAVTHSTRRVQLKRGLYVDSWTEHKLADGQWVIHGVFSTSVAGSGQLIEEFHYDKGVPHGPYRLYDDDTCLLVGEGILVNGLRQGVCRRFWPNGRIEAEGDYWKGREVGLHRTWYQNGNVHREGAFAVDALGNSVEAGLWRRWFDNGQLQREGCFDYRWGSRYGLWRGWHRSGELAWRGEYTVDPAQPDSWHESGVWSFWHDNGAPAAVGMFDQGLRTGTWFYWAPDGMPVGRMEFAARFASRALTALGE